VKEIVMRVDKKKSLLEAFKETVIDEFDRKLIEAYAENLDSNDLARAFVEQLSTEVACEDEA